MLPVKSIQNPIELSPHLKELAAKSSFDHQITDEKTVLKSVGAVLDRLQTISPQLTQADCLKLLRKAKNDISLWLGAAEMRGDITTKASTMLLSSLADKALDFGLAFLLIDLWRRGVLMPATLDAFPENDKETLKVSEVTSGFGLFILALGKHGGQELNYSSDIDPIFLFDPDRVVTNGKKTPAELYQRLSRSLLDLMERRTPDGYVFRVDLRLRPDPGSTPLCVNSLAAERYYQTHAKNWERAAFIKARFAAGDRVAAEGFLAQIRPWLWRKTIDFVALDEMTKLKAQVQKASDLEGEDEDINVKLGRGGIREIEFYAQIHQLLYGGKHPDLRQRRTDTALEKLAQLGFISSAVSQQMIADYYYLRRVEHAAQVLLDQQTHTLPANQAKLEKIAALVGYSASDDLMDDVSNTMARVHSIYASLLDHQTDTRLAAIKDIPANDSDPNVDSFKDSDHIESIIGKWQSGDVRALTSSTSQGYLSRCLPELLAAFAKAPDPDAAFSKLDHFVQALPSGAQLFALLNANPNLLTLLARVMAFAPALADRLANQPMLFGSILEPSFYEPLETGSNLDQKIDEFFRDSECPETTLDAARRANAELQFRAGIHLLEGLSPPADVAKFLSDCADRLVRLLSLRVLADFKVRHGSVPGAGLALLALGRWGGQFLTFSSDLDLIFLYATEDDGNVLLESDGLKPLASGVYFNRLAQRLSSAFTAPTTVGPLYEIDTRLRPSGSQGPLAVNLSALSSYFKTDAWTWEKMAMTRARKISLISEIDGLDDAIIKTLVSEKQEAEIKADAFDMRQKLKVQFDKSLYWDVKHHEAGLVDIEFIIQTLVLIAARQGLWSESISGVSDLVITLDLLTRKNLLDYDDRQCLEEAYRLQSDLLMLLRLSVGENMPDKDDLSPSIAGFICATLGFTNIHQLMTRLNDLRTRITQIYGSFFDGPSNDHLTM